jgi:transcriptional regulator GlxA family with amidase domain
VPTAQGAAIRAALDWPDLGPDDLIVVPGWRAPTLARTGPLSESVTRRLSEHHARGGTVASVCAGTDVLGRAGHLSDAVHRAQDLIDSRFTERLPLAYLATASGVSQRTLTRLFGQATGMSPLRYQQLLRTERAEHLIGHGATVEAAARAAGFEDARMLRRLRAQAKWPDAPRR